MGRSRRQSPRLRLQTLLSPHLIPNEYKKTFPTISAAEIAFIEKVDADVAPDRKSAEPILTLRHTESGVRKWKPVARMRRVQRLLDEGFTIDEIAGETASSVAGIRKTIREFRLLQLALNLTGLTVIDKAKLDDPSLKTNPYTRFFELSNVKEYLGLKFDGNGEISIAPPRKLFDAKLKLVVKAYLNDPDFDTRTDPSNVLGADFVKFKTKPSTPPPKITPSPAPSQVPPVKRPPAPSGPLVRPDRFFESLSCRVSDNSIAAVVGEIKKVVPDVHPISATYLLRTLIELCLRRVIDASGKTIPGARDPTLTDLVNFALNNRSIFPSSRMADVIDAARSQKAFDYLNIVVHQKWMNADPTTCKSVANQLRNFIRQVVEGTP